MSLIEILAPAGNEEMLKAAVFSGADAVYLGFAGFNARAGAGNFTAESLKEACAFCHARGVKVHVALNTTVYTEELPALAKAVKAAAEAGADALIVQDLAVAALAKKICPALPLHASTQMTVHTLQGALAMQRLGFSRVILARELTRQEIETITKGCKIETEIFVHGALCMSVSGQCYMSAFLGGRSGNRGSCAGTCRLPFSCGSGQQDHHLSLKDNSLLNRLNEIQQMGVVSAKIEGRLRTPEYVAAAVSAARAGREGHAFDENLLRDVFSRSGFTSAYYQDRRGADMFGMRTAEDSAAARAALPKLRELFRREYSRVPVDMTLTVEEEGARLAVKDAQGNSAVVYGETAPEPAKSDLTENLKRSLEKTGGTPFTAGSVQVVMEAGNWYLPGSAVNALRRSALEKLEQKRGVPPERAITSVAVPPFAVHKVPERKKLVLRFESISQMTEANAELADLLILPLAQGDQVPEALRAKTVLELPRVTFGGEENSTAASMKKFKPFFKGFCVHNIGQIEAGRGMDLYGGFGLNITNALSASAYAGLGLKGITLLPELTDVRMASVAPGIPTAALAYGYMPLMITRACPLHNVTDCARCARRGGTLTDRKHKQFAVRCSGSVRTIYNCVPIYMGDKPEALPVDAVILYFTMETAEQAEQIARRFMAQKPFEGEFTRGLYFKGTQSGNDAINKEADKALVKE